MVFQSMNSAGRVKGNFWHKHFKQFFSSSSGKHFDQHAINVAEEFFFCKINFTWQTLAVLIQPPLNLYVFLFLFIFIYKKKMTIFQQTRERKGKNESNFRD